MSSWITLPNSTPITPATRGAAAGRPPLLGPGVALGALGVLGFSFSLPATRLAVADLDPWLVAFGRAVVAGVLAVAVPRARPARRGPTAAQWRSLALVAIGVVVGFPLFTSLALHDLTAAHGAVVVGCCPPATAVAAVAARRRAADARVLAGERRRPRRRARLRAHPRRRRLGGAPTS